MAILRRRYTGSPETAFGTDIRQIAARGLAAYADPVIKNELPASFWTGMLPQLMDTSSSSSPYFLAYQAAQAKRYWRIDKRPEQVGHRLPRTDSDDFLLLAIMVM